MSDYLLIFLISMGLIGLMLVMLVGVDIETPEKFCERHNLVYYLEHTPGLFNPNLNYCVEIINDKITEKREIVNTDKGWAFKDGKS